MSCRARAPPARHGAGRALTAASAAALVTLAMSPQAGAASHEAEQAAVPVCRPNQLTMATNVLSQLIEARIVNTGETACTLGAFPEEVWLLGEYGNRVDTATFQEHPDHTGEPVTLDPDETAILRIRGDWSTESCSDPAFGVNVQLPGTETVLYAPFTTTSNGFITCDDSLAHYSIRHIDGW